MLQNLKLLFSERKIILAYPVMVAILLAVWLFFTDHKNMFGNYGPWHTWIDIILSLIAIFGFPLFILAWLYRSFILGGRAEKKEHLGVLGGLVAIIVSGSTCCGATLAVYFGLMPLMMMLPYDGLEIKVVAVAGLLYGLWVMLTRLTTCMVVPPKK